MKKFKSLIVSATCVATALSSIPFYASAEDDENIVYGTMNIPYADFYKAELSGSTNEYEVDAVSSATTTKWSKNGEGELFEGTYNQANDDGTGTILGVTYPVAISQSDLEKLGDNNYNFTSLDSEPDAYKIVTIDEDNENAVSFSAVQDNSPETLTDAVAELSTDTRYGDYIIDIKNTPDSLGAIYGAVIKTTDGGSYAMRHEENIWRGEFAWSSGFKTVEPHGNTLSYENFTGLMGSTISEIIYITTDGYSTVNTSLYVPVKFDGSVSVENSTSGDGTTAVTVSGFPDDYDKNYSVENLNADFTDTEISYTGAVAGNYTLTVSDGNGKYADVTTTFTLSTDSIPATYSDLAIVKTDDADTADYENFLKNISKVSVNGTEYSASGKGAVKIVNDDGTINLEASSRDSVVFSGSDSYEVVITSSGYNNSLSFTIDTTSTNEPVTTTTTDNNSNSTTTTTTTNTATNLTTAVDDNNGTTTNPTSSTNSTNSTSKTTSTTSAKSTTTTTTNSSSTSSSPQTGVDGVAIPVTILAISSAMVYNLKKRKK